MRNLIEKTLNQEVLRALEAGITREGIEQHIRYLCEEIGVRSPGTPEERRGAEYVAGVLESQGWAVEVEEISYLAWIADATRVEMVAPEAKPLPATWFSYTLPTSPGGVVAPVAYVGMEGEEDWSEAAGCLAIVGRAITTSPGRRDLIGRAHAAGAVGYLEFCTAIPPELPKVGNAASSLSGRREPLQPADLPPLPAASLALSAVEEIKALLASGISPRLRLLVGPKDGRLHVWRTSPNVVGTVPGGDLADEIVYVIGHHDANVVGAHDNASGASAVLNFGRWLKESGHRPRRTIRLFLPGCEQFGMVGSTQHVLRNPEAMARTVFAMDWGAIGDGDAMWVDRTPDAGPLFDHLLAATNYARDIPTVVNAPAVASDHCGFLWRAGIPACELHFREFHYLFTSYDDPAHIDTERARRSAVFGAAAALGFADQGPLPLDFAATAAELGGAAADLAAHPAHLYRRDELLAGLQALGVAGQRANALAERLSSGQTLVRFNAGLRAAARAVDPTVTGEFKLLPSLRRKLGDYQEVAALARRLPRRLIEKGDVLPRLTGEREQLAAEARAEAEKVIAALDEATRALSTACEDLP